MGYQTMEDRSETPISDGIRAAIRASGRSPYNIAADVKCSPQQLYNFLGSKRRLSQDTMDALAVALDLEIRVRPKPTVGVEAALIEVDSFDLARQQDPVASTQVIGKSRSTEEDKDQIARKQQVKKQNDLIQETSFDVPQATQEPTLDKETPGGGLGGPTPPAAAKIPRPKAKLNLRPNTDQNADDFTQRAAAAMMKRRGVMPANMFSPGVKPLGRYDPDSAAIPEPEHVNAQQADRKMMLDLWPGTEKLYKSMGRDQEAKKNIYTFLSVLSRSPNTTKYLGYIKGLALDKIINWSLAFPPEQQIQIANSLPMLDDGAVDEDPSITKSFWDRVDKDSFYKAVERLGFLPNPALISKYIDRKTPISTTGPNPQPDDSDDTGEIEHERSN